MTKVFLPQHVTIAVTDSGRVRWGFGSDALLGHERQAGFLPTILAKILAQQVVIDRRLASLSVDTPKPLTLTTKDSAINAAAMEFNSLTLDQKNHLRLVGPLSMTIHDRGLKLMLGALDRGTLGAKSKASAYAKGISVETKGSLTLTSHSETSEDPKTHEQVVEDHFGVSLPKPFIIKGQEANDPLTNKEGRIDTLKAGSMNVIVKKVRVTDKGKSKTNEKPAEKKVSEGNVPVILEFRLDKNVEALFKGSTITGDRLFYDRPSDRFILGGAKSNTTGLGVVISGVKRIEIRFPVLSQKQKDEKAINPRREWRIVGKGIKVRTTEDELPKKEDAHDHSK